MKLRTVLIAVVVLVVAVAATGVAIIMSTDFNQYRPLVAEQVKAATGRELNLAGDLDVAVSLVPTVVVNDVSFANADWGTRPEMVIVQRLEVEMELLPLLSGDIRVKRVVLVGADILLETDPSGTPNWTFATAETMQATPAVPPEGGPGLKLPTVHSVAIENARLTYRDGVSGTSQTIALTSLSATATDASSPMQIALEGALNDNPIKLAGSVGAVQGLLDDQPFPIDLTGEGGGATFSVKGEIAKPKSAQGLALALSVQGNSLADLTALTGAPMPPLGPYSLSGQLTDVDGGYEIATLQARMGESDIAGSAGVAMGGARPKITAALTSAKLDLKDFGVAPEPAVEDTQAPSGSAGGSDGRVFPADPLPFDGLKAVDAVVKFTGQQVIKAPITFENVVVDLALDNGKLTLTQLDTGVTGGTVAVSAVVDASQATPLVSAKVTARQVEAGTLSQTLGITKVLSGGKVDLDLDVTGSGASVREIMAGLNGSSNLEMGEGRINNRFAEIVLADLVKLLTFSGSGDSSNLNCMVVRFDFKDGLATSTGLVVDTNGATIVGSGDIRLDSEKLDMRADPSAKETNLVNLAIPVIIGGTLASPSVAPDPAALAKGVAGAAVGAATGAGVFGALAGLTGTGGASGGSTSAATGNPCADALAGGGEAAAPQSTSEQILDGAGSAIEGAGDAAKDAGEAIKDLFQ
jgi:hypothetical protein